MNGDPRLYQILSDLEITFEYHEHPPVPTIEAAMKYLGLTAGSVSPFGIINDIEKHVHLFMNESLKTARRLSFHPNINTASLIISYEDFMKFLHWTGNSWEFIDLKE